MRWLGVRRSEVALWKELVTDAGVEEVEVFADTFAEEGHAQCSFLNYPPGARRLATREEEAKADEAPISYRDAALAAKDETIAELRQRVASLEQHLETLESLLAAALERGVERPAPLDENKRESPQEPPEGASEVSGGAEETREERRRIDGRRLKRIREDRWMNQEDLANRAGLSIGTVNRIERGITPHSHRHTILRLAEVLDVHPDELLVKR
jgi:DNA-binding Xre family transcriptional regulator